MQRFKNNAIYAVVRAAYALLLRLPLGWISGLGSALGVLAYAVAARERRRAMDNLSRAYPLLSHATRAALVRRMWIDMARSLLEMVTAARLSREELSQRVELSARARQVLATALGEGRGVLFASAHYGNWELLAARVAADVDVSVSVLAKPSYDERLTAMIERMRAALGVHDIWVDRPSHLRRALGALRGGAIVGVLVDQPVRGAPGVPFFGERAPTSRMLDVLARLSGAAVVCGFIRRQGQRHVIDIELLARDDTATFSQRTTATVEQAVRRAPTQWAWSLDRWRSDKAQIVSRVDGPLVSEK
ncbi:MAG: lipid A biosynthesis acyltransferase [Myxococcales bacterium]|nr:lipid A biosynthesis acyltransferase [Myxococcales bacterium]